jgi:anti-sigma factor RsiW
MSDPRLRALLGPEGPELTCEQCFAYLDEFVEAEVAGRDPEPRVPGMRAHLAGCPACAEDHASLLALVSSQQSE